MRYYNLRCSSDPAVLRNNSGIKQADIARQGFTDPSEYDRITKDLGTNHYWEIRDSVPTAGYYIQCVELWGKSHRTDFLRFGPFLFHCPFMISEKVDQVFSEHKILGAITFPAQLKKGSDAWEYRLFYIVPMPLSGIDFEKSSFYEGDVLTGKTLFSFNGEREMEEYRASSRRVQIQEFWLKKELAGMDMLSLPNGELVVSEKLRNALENKGASGANLLPAFGDVPWPTVFVSE